MVDWPRQMGFVAVRILPPEQEQKGLNDGLRIHAA